MISRLAMQVGKAPEAMLLPGAVVAQGLLRQIPIRVRRAAQVQGENLLRSGGVCGDQFLRLKMQRGCHLHRNRSLRKSRNTWRMMLSACVALEVELRSCPFWFREESSSRLAGSKNHRVDALVIVVQKFDRDHDGMLNFDEFANWVASNEEVQCVDGGSLLVLL